MSGGIGNGITFDDDDITIPGPGPRAPHAPVATQPRPTPTDPAASTTSRGHLSTVAPAPEPVQANLPGTPQGSMRQLSCLLSPKVAAAVRRAKSRYDTYGHVLIHALHGQEEALVEHFAREASTPSAPEEGFVIPATRSSRRRTSTGRPVRVAINIDPTNARQLADLMLRCHVGEEYSELCDEALRRFLKVRD